MEFNGGDGNSCDATFYFDETRNGIIFSIELGECGMTAVSVEHENQKFIKFSEHFSFAKPQDNDFLVFFRNYFSSSFGFHCFYTASTFTKVNTFSVNTQRHSSDIEKFVSWDSTFDITFFENDDFQKNLPAADLFIGDTLYARASWRQTFKESFPVEFYIDYCSVQGGNGGSTRNDSKTFLLIFNFVKKFVIISGLSIFLGFAIYEKNRLKSAKNDYCEKFPFIRTICTLKSLNLRFHADILF